MLRKSGSNDKWTVEGRRRIVVTLNPGAGRYIFGVPWLLFGVYFLFRYLILGIAEYVRAGDIAGVFTGALGWLFIILFFGCIFIIPGWVLVFLRRKVVVDASRGRVEEKNDLLVFSRSKTHPLVPKAAGDERGYVLIGTMQDEAEAERLGRATAELTDLPYAARQRPQRI
jgi:hypothetical protein